MQLCENSLKHYKEKGSFVEGKLKRSIQNHVLSFISSKFKALSLFHLLLPFASVFEDALLLFYPFWIYSPPDPKNVSYCFKFSDIIMICSFYVQ